MRNLLILLLLTGLLTACGGGAEESATSESKSEPATTAAAEPAKKETPAKKGAGVTIELNAGDDMQYDTKLITVDAGKSVTVNLTHTGQMAKEVMGHNFVLLNEYTDVDDFAAAAMKAKDNDYIPESDEIIAHTGMIGGGETTSVTFDAPAKGTYDFLCTFPGHYGVMKGKFIVQ